MRPAAFVAGLLLGMVVGLAGLFAAVFKIGGQA